MSEADGKDVQAGNAPTRSAHRKPRAGHYPVTGTLLVTQMTAQPPNAGSWLLPTHQASQRATTYLSILLLEWAGEPEDGTDVSSESVGQGDPNPVSLDHPGCRRVQRPGVKSHFCSWYLSNCVRSQRP